MNSTQAIEVPTLNAQTLALATNFAAYKADEKLSFVRPYDPRVTDVPMFRHAVIRFRNTDKNTVSKPAQMVTVPQLQITDDFAIFADSRMEKVILGLLEDEQDNIIRSKIDSGVSNIGWNDLSLNAVLDSLTAVRMSSRLTKEQIELWFKVAAKDVCETRAVQISEQKGFNQEQRIKQIAGTLNAYCNLACKLAAPVPNLGTQEAIALKNLLLQAKLADDMSKVLLAKLEAILNPKVVENIDL